jgi:hypothetical protein
MTVLSYQTADAQESRNGAFGDGAAARFQERGVQAIQENRPSALSVGRSETDPSTGVMAGGQRYVVQTSDGESDATRQAEPTFTSVS